MPNTEVNEFQNAAPLRALIAGCGDVGLRVVRRLRTAGGEVTAILRDPQKRAPLIDIGADVLLADLDTPVSAGDWPWLFWFAPPPGEGDGDPRLRNWLRAQRGRIDRIVYISTSGVYGDCDGRWIDEEAPLQPKTPRARRRVDAEAGLAAWATQHRCDHIILRVPGIYGPGRLPAERLSRGMPVLRETDAPYSNRIHADDLAEAAVLAAFKGVSGRAYNIADGHPTTMTDYFTRCARLLDLPLPEQVDLEEARQRFTPAMWSFMEESKRLKTDRARVDLGFVPRYPDLEHGLPACLRG